MYWLPQSSSNLSFNGNRLLMHFCMQCAHVGAISQMPGTLWMFSQEDHCCFFIFMQKISNQLLRLIVAGSLWLMISWWVWFWVSGLGCSYCLWLTSITALFIRPKLESSFGWCSMCLCSTSDEERHCEEHLQFIMFVCPFAPKVLCA